MKDQLPSFLGLYKVIKSAGVTQKEAVNTIKCANEIPQLRNTHQNLKNDNTGLGRQRNRLLSDLYFLQDKVEELRGYVQHYQNELNEKYCEREALNKEIHDLEDLAHDKWTLTSIVPIDPLMMYFRLDIQSRTLV